MIAIDCRHCGKPVSTERDAPVCCPAMDRDILGMEVHDGRRLARRLIVLEAAFAQLAARLDEPKTEKRGPGRPRRVA